MPGGMRRRRPALHGQAQLADAEVRGGHDVRRSVRRRWEGRRQARQVIVVLGIGGMGAAALAHIAARGERVIGIEQDDVPSARGSSHGETRVIRKAYFEDPRYVPLLERAYELWSKLEDRVGERLLFRTGCLNVGPADHPAIAGVEESVRRHALAHERLDEAAMRARFPALVPNVGDVGIFEEDGGFLRVEACTRAHAQWAVAAGAELRTKTRVTAIDRDGPRLRVTLDDGDTLVADRLVVSAGAWLASAAPLRAIAEGLPLSVERQVQLYFQPRQSELVTAPTLPAFIHFEGERAFYGIPLHGEGEEPAALKVCRHHGGAITTADALDRTLHDEDVDVVRAFLRARLPTGDGPLLRAKVCMYTNTPDHAFVIGAAPAHPNVVVLGGFSGHGFKMASVIGEIAADLATSGKSRFDLGLFRPDRFATTAA